MRPLLCLLAALVVLVSARAAAQSDTFQMNPNTVLRIERAHILDGVWQVGGGFGPLTMTTRPDGALEGQLGGRACQGEYRSNAFALLCRAEERGPVIFSGIAVETPPVATTARRAW